MAPAGPAPPKKHVAPSPPTDWSQLASTLGLPSSEELGAPTTQRERPAAKEPQRPQPVEEKPRERPPSMFEPAHKRVAPPPQSSAREAADGPQSNRPQPARPPRDEFEHEPSADKPFEAEEPIDAELVDEEGTREPSARGEDGGPPKRRRRRRGGRRSRRDRRPDEQPAADEGESAPDDRLEATAPAEENDEPREAGSEEPRERKGRRRRRRRGSDRGRPSTRGAGESESRDREDAEDRQDAAAKYGDEDEGDEADDLAAVGFDAGDALEESSDEDNGDGQLGKNSHRAIPSWEEALGYIISNNMEARAKNPKASGSRGRGRGGSRGGHERRSS